MPPAARPATAPAHGLWRAYLRHLAAHRHPEPGRQAAHRPLVIRPNQSVEFELGPDAVVTPLLARDYAFRGERAGLQRLLEILAELRETSQLIIVTHQKRSMEVADTLYGISMRGDGVSTVISERLRERETV
jgi:hypothetical protein